MKITIHGADYTASLDVVQPLRIERKLNAPSVCEFQLSLPVDGSLPVPSRMQYVLVHGDDGMVYFTGYIAVTPMPEFVGISLHGLRYRYQIQALSDELILDQQLISSGSGVSGQTVSQLLSSLVLHSGSTAISTAGLSLSVHVNNVQLEAGSKWSSNASAVAGQSRAAYKAVNGALSVVSVGETVHTLSEAEGTLNPAHLAFSSATKRALANDVTVCGEHEPRAYISEYFVGDGSTTEFMLSAEPFALSSAKTTIIDELFNELSIDSRDWSVVASTGYLTLGSGGLVMKGGNGVDGETLLSWIDPVELGGTLLLEASGIALQAGSSGIVAGVFTSDTAQAGCICGFQITTQSGAVVVQPFVCGSAAGTSTTLNSASLYTLRIRLHCNEMQRNLSIYRSFGDQGAISAGGQSNTLNALVQMEIQSYVDGVAGTPVTVFDGTISALSDTGVIVPASSLSLVGTMRSFRLNNLGSAWVVCTPSGGSAYTRRIGSTSVSAECHVEKSGRLVFYSGYTPSANEQIAVFYRSIGRAVGRAVNAASQTALQAAGSPVEAAWIGSVTSPVARSSADCRNAATAMEEAAAGTVALWAGIYKGLNVDPASDVWPGDALEVVAASLALDVQVVVRSVKLTYIASLPDRVAYEIAFANDWADDLAIQTSTTVPADTWLPAAIFPTYLNNLNALMVTAVSGSAVTINTGAVPPSGGGFEVRRRDYCFQTGTDCDLVLRATTQNFTLARQSATDRFYVRMYDSAYNYSEFSAAVFINFPLSS